MEKRQLGRSGLEVVPHDACGLGQRLTGRRFCHGDEDSPASGTLRTEPEDTTTMRDPEDTSFSRSRCSR